MLGAYPLATRPLATLGGGQNIVEAVATAVITVTSSFDANSTAGADASSSVTLAPLFDSGATASSDASSSLSLSPSFDAAATASSEAASSLTLTPAFDSQEVTVLSADVTTSAALSSAFDSQEVTVLSTDATTTLALTPAFDSQTLTVVGSDWSVIINPAIGPVASGGATVANGGSGYISGASTQFIINGGNGDAIGITQTTTGAPNYTVTSINIINSGSGGYVVGQTYPTTRISGGGGSGLTVTVTSVTDIYARFRGATIRARSWASTPTLTTNFKLAAVVGADTSSTLALLSDWQLAAVLKLINSGAVSLFGYSAHDMLVKTSPQVETPVDADVLVELTVTSIDLFVEAHIPVHSEGGSFLGIEDTATAQLSHPIESDAVSGINVSTDDRYTIDTLDADVEVIVNVTATDLDIEAHIPTVTDDVFFVEQLNAVSASSEAPIDLDVVSGVEDSASASGQAVLVPLSLQGILNEANEAAAYEYEGGLEQHYLQTAAPGFAWAPMAAAGIEAATGRYSFFVKVLQTHAQGGFPYAPEGYYASVYDDFPVPDGQVVGAIKASSTEGELGFYGTVPGGGTDFNSNFQTQWHTTPFVAVLTIDTIAVTAEYRAYHQVYGSSLSSGPVSIAMGRTPLHFCVNAQGFNFGPYHAGSNNFAQMKFIAAGLINNGVTDQQVMDYALSRDARPIFGSTLKSYWTASVIDHDANIDPPLQIVNVVDSSKPLLLNGHFSRSDQYPLPKSNPFTIVNGVDHYLSSRALIQIDPVGDAFADILNEVQSTARFSVQADVFADITYQSVSLYATAQLTITPEAYLAFAVKCVKAYLTNDPGTQATFVDSTGTEALFVNEPGTIAVLIKCR